VEVDWLKKDWTSRISAQDKRACIDVGQPQQSIARQCELDRIASRELLARDRAAGGHIRYKMDKTTA
jgi:hypothetical protein